MDVATLRSAELAKELLGEGMEPPTAASVDSVEVFLARSCHGVQPSLVPDGSGGVSMEWRLADTTFRIDWEEDGVGDAILMNFGKVVTRFLVRVHK